MFTLEMWSFFFGGGGFCLGLNGVLQFFSLVLRPCGDYLDLWSY